MSITDRELLELAARASGMRMRVSSDGEWFADKIGNGYFGYWNPLTDDGDAFRLMVQLDLFSPCVVAQWKLRIKPEKYPDVAAEYRRAVVEVAAEIGKEMK